MLPAPLALPQPIRHLSFSVIDFHTHHPERNPQGISLFCHTDLLKDLPSFVLEKKSPFCAGLHPWFLPSSWEEGLRRLEKWRSHPQFLGLGECGLDRVRGPEFSLQLEFFERQIQWAKKETIPFVVLHSVRSIPECFGAIKKVNFPGKVIFHDYMANAEQTNQLLNYPQVYFSLGRALEGRGKLLKEFDLIDKTLFEKRLFVETDDCEISISERYHQLSQLLGHTTDQLSHDISSRFEQLTH